MARNRRTCSTCYHDGCCFTHCGGRSWSPADDANEDEWYSEDNRWMYEAMAKLHREDAEREVRK